jgi:hypothetical protein
MPTVTLNTMAIEMLARTKALFIMRDTLHSRAMMEQGLDAKTRPT